MGVVLSEQAALIALCALFGLTMGGFLNMVIVRLPLMMESAWESEARTILDDADTEEQPADARLTLLRPASHCPHCAERIPLQWNIPVVGWALLQGRAACCGARISPQYPLVEIAAALLAAACAWRFGFGWELGAALVLVCMLLTAATIDWNTQLLPDDITLPLLWMGLLVNINGMFTPLPEAVIGAAAGYLALWSIFVLFKAITGKEGMGYGDFKLMAALGAWFGWSALPMLLLMASGTGAIVGIGLRLSGELEAGRPMPFGPFIAAGGALWLLAPIPKALVAL